MIALLIIAALMLLMVLIVWYRERTRMMAAYRKSFEHFDPAIARRPLTIDGPVDCPRGVHCLDCPDAQTCMNAGNVRD